jgi:hypothetical protein
VAPLFGVLEDCLAGGQKTAGGGVSIVELENVVVRPELVGQAAQLSE